MAYDSTTDTLEHIKNIQHVMNDIIIPEMILRSKNHDNSKLESPEKEMYDTYIPLLRKATYGSKAEQEIRQLMYDKGLKHHYEHNRHHPEHFENGISGMTLVDLIEHFADTYAASLRSDTGYEKGLSVNAKKFGMCEQLETIFRNTYNEYCKDK